MAKEVFISFCSKNIRQAMDLWKELKQRGISAWFCQDNDLVDPDDSPSIEPGDDYGESIERAIKAAKVFILLLSNDSIESKWVRKELDRALQRDTCVIIPINLDKVVLNDAFNYRLTDVQQVTAQNPLDRTIRSVAARTERILSGELKEDTSYPKARAYAKHERRKRFTTRKVLPVLLALAAVALGIWGFGNRQEIIKHEAEELEKNTDYIRYYADYIWRNGAPEGLDEITQADAAAGAHYEFTIRDSKVRKVRFTDAGGYSMNETASARKDRPAEIDVRYYDEHLNDVTFYDASGKYLLTAVYDFDPATEQLRGIRFTDQDGFSKRLPNDTTALDLDAWLNADTSTRTARYCDVSQLQVVSCDNGLITEVRYGMDIPQKDGSDVSGIEFRYDDAGRVISAEFKYDTVQPEGGDLHYRRYDYGLHRLNSIQEISNDESVLTTTFRYNEAGECVSEQYESLSGSPVARDRDVARITYEYAGGRVVRTAYADRDGQSIPGPDGWAECREIWDGEGRSLEKSYYDAYGNLTLIGKWAKRTVEYDGSRRVTRWFDQNGNPAYQGQEMAYAVTTTLQEGEEKVLLYAYYKKDGTAALWNGAYQARETMDSEGRMIKREVLNGSGKPMMSESGGYAVMKVDYQPQKKITSYWDQTETPVDSSYGYARREVRYTRSMNLTEDVIDTSASGQVISHLHYVYDEHRSGRVIREEYLDENGDHCVPEKTGYAVKAYHYETTETGTRIRTEYKDAEENLVRVPDADGLLYAVSIAEYDSHDLLLFREKLDEADKPVYDPSFGAYACEMVRDARGNVTEIRYLDQDHRLMRKGGEKGGYAKLVTLYNSKNRYYEERFYDEQDRLSADNVFGYAVRTFDNDPVTGAFRGTAFFDAERQPVTAPAFGFAKSVKTYDAAGRWTSASYYDAAGGLVMYPAEGYASITLSYENGEKWTYWGADGQRIIHAENGYASCELGYDADGNTVRITFLDEHDRLMVAEKRGYAELTRQYENGECVLESYFNGNREPMINPLEGCAARKTEVDPETNETCVTYLDGQGRPMINEKKGYCALRTAYNENRLPLKETFCGTDGNPMLCGGYASVEYEYNEAGQSTVLRYLNTDGALIYNAEEGFARREMSYDEQGRNTEVCYYDENNRLFVNPVFGYARVVNDINPKDEVYAWTYYGEDGKPAINTLYRYARMERDFDANGNVIAERYYGTDLAPLAVDGVASRVWTYNDKREVVSWEQYDADGNPLGSSGSAAAEIREETARDGNTETTVFLDAEGKTVMNPEKGYAKLVNTLDEAGRSLRREYYDDQDHLIAPASLGYACLTHRYDASGNTLEWAYFDAEMKPVIEPSQGYARIVNGYDAENRVIRRDLYDAEDKLFISPVLGYASVDIRFDAWGNEAGWMCYGPDGQPAVNPLSGYAGIRKVWNENGKQLEEAYLAAEDRLMIPEDRDYARVVWEYTPEGWISAVRYYDEDGNLTNNYEEGGCGWLAEYDSQGRMTRKTFLDEEGRTWFGWDEGPAIIEYSYENEGKVCIQRFLDPSGEPVYSVRDGGWMIRQEFDSDGRHVATDFCGRDGKILMPSAEDTDYSRVVFGYDSLGRHSSTTYCNSDRQPFVSRSAGCCTSAWELDGQGRKLWQEYRDTAGSPMMNPLEGYARVVYRYAADPDGETVEEYYDAAGVRIEDPWLD